MFYEEKKVRFSLLFKTKCIYLLPLKTKKTMKTMFVNTYWWWQPLQLRQS